MNDIINNILKSRKDIISFDEKYLKDTAKDFPQLGSKDYQSHYPMPVDIITNPCK